MSKFVLRYQWKQESPNGDIKDCEYVDDRDYDERYWPSSDWFKTEEDAIAYLEGLVLKNVSSVEFNNYILVKRLEC